MYLVWLGIGLSQAEQDVHWLLAIVYFDFSEITLLEDLSSVHTIEKFLIKVELSAV